MSFVVEWMDYNYTPHSASFQLEKDAEVFAENRKAMYCKDVNLFEEESL